MDRGPRRLARRAETPLAEEPVLASRGPGVVGKSTLLRTIAGGHRVPVFDLDDLPTRDAATADPVSRGVEPR
jgi:hypothetical protein